MVKVPSGRREPQKLLETKRSCHDMPGQSQDVAFTGESLSDDVMEFRLQV